MINKNEVIQNIVITFVILVLISFALMRTAMAEPHHEDIYGLWNTLNEFEEVSSLRSLLLEKDWINEDVPIDELDYILVLTRQCSEEFFPTVPTSLVLSMISMESSFRKDLIGFSQDTGLMQIIPKYHQDRIEKYIYEENVDLYDPRLNVMVGMDYLEELIDWADGDIELAVMAYNMGPLRARVLYLKGVKTSYAKNVLKRMDVIDTFLEGREWPCLS